MNKYIVMFLLGACTLNSYGMHKEQKTIIPHCDTKKKITANNQTNTPHAQQENPDAVIDRQIVIYHYTHNIKPPYPTPITRTFAETVIRQYEETMENE